MSAAAPSGTSSSQAGGRLPVEEGVAEGLEEPGQRVERQQVAGVAGDLVERDSPGARKNNARTSETANGCSSGYQMPNSVAG